MPAYSHLLDEERDQIAVMRAAGRSICAIAGALQRAKSTVSRELRRNACPAGVIRRFTPPEPISCAGGVKPYSRKIRRSKSRYPGREYAYEYALDQTTQFDLHQPTSTQTCSHPPCSCPCDASNGGQCYSGDNKCYFANIAKHDVNTRLRTSYGTAA